MAKHFDTLKIDPLILDGIEDQGYEAMTPIQEQSIPLALDGHDLIAAAQTGTGKTAAFLIPLIDRVIQLDVGAIRAVVLTPTRELALQIDEQMGALAYHAKVSSSCVVGGLSFADQEYAIREKTDVLICTPGRLIDHMKYDHVDLSHVEFLVFDEADRMLDMGFLPDVQKIVDGIPKKRQTLLFSATISDDIKKLAHRFLKEPKVLQIGKQVPVSAIKQRFISVPENSKENLLAKLLRGNKMESVIVFARTKKSVRLIDRKLYRLGVACDAIHGDRPQEERVEALNAFRRGDINVLVATDIASRGLDIPDVSHVINVDIPQDPADYIHRVGRTARAKKEGEAITFVTDRDSLALKNIENAIGKKADMERSDFGGRPSGGRKHSGDRKKTPSSNPRKRRAPKPPKKSQA